MSTTPPDAPAEPDAAHDPGPDHDGPRVGRDEVRDLGRLRRSTTDRKVAGVAGGLARHLDVDPVLLRVAFVVLVFFGGAGLVLYGAVWLLVPEDDDTDAPFHLDDRTRTVALTVVGAVALLAVVGDSWGVFGFPWPLAVVALVALLLLNRSGRRRPAAPSAPMAPPTSWQPAAEAAGPAPAPVTRPMAPPRTPPDPRRRGPRLFWFTMALAALGIGVLGLLETGGVPVADAAYPALVATVCAAMLLLGSVWGRPGGLVAVGLLAALAMVATTAANEVEGSSRTEQPTVAEDLRPAYRMGAGRLVLDLTRLTDLEQLDDRVVVVEGGVGELEVVVPDEGLDVVARSEVGVGGTATFQERRDGLGVETDAAHDGGGGAPTLLLEVRLGVGDVEISTEEISTEGISTEEGSNR